MTDYLAAVVQNADYIDRKFGPTALPYTDHIRAYAARIGGLPTATPSVPAPTDVDSFPDWEDGRAGTIDYTNPNESDTYGLLVLWVTSALGWETPPAGSLFADPGRPSGDTPPDTYAHFQALMLATGILADGAVYYPVSIYPVIPSDVLSYIFGTTDPAALAAIVAAHPSVNPSVYRARPEVLGGTPVVPTV